MILPRDHPRRAELHDEIHARPPESLPPPSRLTYLVLVSERARGEEERALVADLARRFGATPPPPGANHYSADLGRFRFRWERHTEFARYQFMLAGSGPDEPFATPAIDAAPAEWIAALPGSLLFAANAIVVAKGAIPDDAESVSRRVFAGHPVVGAMIGEGVGRAFADFHVHADGFSRFVIEDRGMTPRQAGRMAQRLLEIETYRLMALLALPVARELSPVLDEHERSLTAIAFALVDARAADEPALLDRLTRLEAEIESRVSDSHYRFSAAEAYYDLVRRRIAELRETRIPGLQTVQEFMERRLAPAMSTCRSVAARHDTLSERNARATQLLSTRVAVNRQGQNQAVLESMNRRARLQLRLQQTVEGLSIAAITYYVVGLIGYAAKGLGAAGVPLDTEIAMGAAVPAVALLAAFGVRRIRRMVGGTGT